MWCDQNECDGPTSECNQAVSNETRLSRERPCEEAEFDCAEIPYENTVMVENGECEVLATKPIITTDVKGGQRFRFRIESFIESF